jgi:[acyl-carrier-protein] S-malonyltransferase
MIAVVFPGQGAQKVGMGRELAAAFPICRDTFAEADEALGYAISRLCFEGPEQELQLTENTQPAILAASVAAWRVVAAQGLRPSAAAGHSLGEYSAHVAAGTLSFADALRTVRRRGQYMQQAVPVGEGAMAAILGLDFEGIAAACSDASQALGGRVVSPANLNAPGQVVIAGHLDAVQRAGELAKARGAKRVIPLAVSAPFHCALMQPAQDRLAPELRAIESSDPRFPVVANVDVSGASAACVSASAPVFRSNCHRLPAASKRTASSPGTNSIRSNGRCVAFTSVLVAWASAAARRAWSKAGSRRPFSASTWTNSRAPPASSLRYQKRVPSANQLGRTLVLKTLLRVTSGRRRARS